MTGPVLVIGATGQQGGATARELLARGRTVHALVRDPQSPAAKELRDAGAHLVPGDLDDPSSLRTAMADAHGVFLVLTMMTGPRVTPEGVANEERRGKLVADIAKQTGIAHLVYSSVSGAGQNTGIPHLESKTHIEAHIHALDLPATVLRPVFFMDNFATHTRPVLIDRELVLNLALRPTTPMSLISTHDIGTFAALAFEAPDRFLGHTLTIAADTLTAPEIAEHFGAAAGLPARFHQTPIAQLQAFDEEVAKMFTWFDTGPVAHPDLAQLRELHSTLMTLTTWLHTTNWKP